MAHLPSIRTRLRNWYTARRRDLPWRRTGDPYHIWVSEIMLQQTRVAAVLPYYERFLERFPTVEALARAAESEVLAAWSGLGYYSRARNLREAARRIAGRGAFPSDYEEIRELPGIGDYTAAAIASIAFGQPYAVVDGNVLRVLARFTGDPGDIGSAVTRRRLTGLADQLLDRRRPGEHNQAVMELGATVCTPRLPRCPACPLLRYCEARRRGIEHQLPVKLGGKALVRVDRTVLLIQRRGRILLRQRPAGSARLAGFWELPAAEDLPGARPVREHGAFRHSITNHNYRFTVMEARIRRAPGGYRWVPLDSVGNLPLSTTTRKAIALAAG